MSSQPWIKFYPRDWRGDQALRIVSVGARGLWMEMLCVMHEASPYGHLILGGRALENADLARLAGIGADEAGALIAELESAGVFSRTRKGVIFSRRMVKDKRRAENGRKSVEKRWSQSTDKEEEIEQPNRSTDRLPITQKPEARSQRTPSSPPEGMRKILDVLDWPNPMAFEDRDLYESWIATGADLDSVIIPTIRGYADWAKRKNKRIRSFAELDRSVREAIAVSKEKEKGKDDAATNLAKRTMEELKDAPYHPGRGLQ